MIRAEEGFLAAEDWRVVALAVVVAVEFAGAERELDPAEN